MSNAVELQTDGSTDAQKLVNRAAQTAHELVDRVADKAAPAVDRVQEQAQALCNAEERWVASCRNSIREHPLTCVSVAALGGMLLSRLLAR